MTERESRESWVVTENTQQYTPDSDPDRDESWVQTDNTQQYEHDDDQAGESHYGVADL